MDGVTISDIVIDGDAIIYFFSLQSTSENEGEFRLQEQFGRPFVPGEFLIFQAQVLHPQSVVSFLIKIVSV